MLDAAAAQRITAIAARTASGSDGEALNATRILHRELERAGLRLSDVVAEACGQRIDRSCVTPSRPQHQRDAIEALRAAYILSDRQREFLHSMAAADRCSEIQRHWISDLLCRARRAAAC